MPVLNDTSLETAITLCSTDWLKRLLRKELPQVLSVRDTPDGHRQARQWDALIKAKMAQRGLVSPAQQKNPITDVRQVIKAIDPNHPALDDIGFSSEEWTEINLPAEGAIAARVAKPIDNPDEIARRAAVLLKSEEWSEVAAGLAVATGRRSAEVLKTAHFEIASTWSVRFTGALKRGGEEVQLRFEIPTLVEAAQVVKAWRKLRSLVDTAELSKRQVNNTFSQAIAQACDLSFKGLVPQRQGKDNLYTHLFRSVYSTIACFWFCPPAVPELEFRAAIQGHYKVMEAGQTELRRSLAASRHYFDYEMADAVIAAHNGQRKGVRLKEPGVEVLQAFRTGEQQVQVQVKEEEAMGLRRVSVSEQDKDRVIDLQERLRLGTQNATMTHILDLAESAIALAEVLGCGPEDVASAVQQVLDDLEQQRQAARQAQAQLQEAERALRLVERGGRDNPVMEQSLAMANRFNAYLEREIEQLKGEREQLLSESQNLRSQLGEFEALQAQFQQFQRLLSGNGAQVAPVAPVAPAQPKPSPSPQVHPADSAAPGPGPKQKAANTDQETVKEEDGRVSLEGEREIHRLIDQIIQFNDQVATDDDERWQISQSVLKKLSCRYLDVIKRVMEQRADDIQNLHDKYGMHSRVFNRGKNFEDLKQAIGITE